MLHSHNNNNVIRIHGNTLALSMQSQLLLNCSAKKYRKIHVYDDAENNTNTLTHAYRPSSHEHGTYYVYEYMNVRHGMLLELLLYLYYNWIVISNYSRLYVWFCISTCPLLLHVPQGLKYRQIIFEIAINFCVVRASELMKLSCTRIMVPHLKSQATY